MEVCSSNEMDAQVPRIWERETMQPNQPKQTKISPGKRRSQREPLMSDPVRDLRRHGEFSGRIHRNGRFG